MLLSLRVVLRAALLVLVLAACQSTGAQPQTVEFTINGKLSGVNADSVLLTDLFLGKLNRIAVAKVTEGQFTLKGRATSGMYTLIIGQAPVGQVAVLNNRPISLTLAQGMNGPTATFTEATLNQDLAMYLDMQRRYQQEVQQVYGQAQQGQMSRERAIAVTDSMRKPQQTMNLKTAERKDLVGAVAALYSYEPYGSDTAHKRYANELDYFKRGFFATSRIDDPMVAMIPTFYEKVYAYASNLIQVGTSATESRRWIDSLRRHVAPSARADQGILYSAMGAAEPYDPDLFAQLGLELMAKHPQVPLDSALKNKVRQLARVSVGQVAPDIALSTPEGKELKLSSLRGKVVLVDFWASWCGPCRKENPNVVKVYAKYKDKGFEIYGVSLDRDRPSWLGAIAADKLTWLHVSDLKFWQSAAAQTWGVSAIPFTVLLDPEGRIIAKNLRGPALEAKLNELFN